ncbi:MAG: DNA polymerase/3'-5' exonuclease PolX [Candidatus Staskawiczbacteria bacterium]|nr:DNA polymerase/3'-5' exonuclease PolX [Candidatus Staskawiczbacteria bacterium]
MKNKKKTSNGVKNQELSKIFFEMADYLEIEGVDFKPYAYRKVALSLDNWKEDVGEIYRSKGIKGLQEIPGVGEGIAKAIEEYLKSGKIKSLEELKKKLPLKVDELLRVESLGPKKIKVLYRELGVKDLKDLGKAAKAHKISPLFGFGEKTEQNILQGLEFLKRSKGRFLLGDIMPTVKIIEESLRARKEIKEVSVAGSVRRQKETIGDIDILVVSENPKKTADFFVSLPEVEKIWAEGSTKCSVRLKAGFDVDLRMVKRESFGSALQYFTGSKEHNISTRKIAIEKGLKLSEYGVFEGNPSTGSGRARQIAGATEEDVYKAIGLSFVAPEMREDDGEIQAVLNGSLPVLIKQKDIKGDLHCHTVASDGKDSIEEMVRSAMDLGYEYVGISDHTKFLGVTNGLDEKEILKQHKKIEELNAKFKKQNLKFRVLHGCEADIMLDGSLNAKDEILEKLDYVIASVHSGMKMEKKKMTARIIKAIKNRNVDIFGHPTGRLIGKRDEYQMDFDKILEVAKENGTILEINSSPLRLDLNGFNIRRAKTHGLKMIINTDSHNKEQLNLMEYGIGQAHRGWAEKADIINTLSVEKLLEFFK